MANDFKFGSKAIIDLYLGNKAVLQVYFGNKLIWEKFVKQLVAGTQFVSFEFIPTEDITIDHIGIFTADTYTGTTVNFAIYHESGLVVAKTNADTASSTEEKYGLTGQRRVVTVNGVLKRGLKYYIQYTDTNGNTVHPAYFQNSQSSITGETGKYKVFTYGQVQNKSVADLSNANEYKGGINSTVGIFNMAQGDFFLWNGDYSMTPGHIYMRSSVGAGTPFAGVIGNPTSPTTITSQDILSLIAKPNATAFIWYVSQYPNMATGSIWKKENDFATNTVDFTGYDSGPGEMGHLLYTLNQTNNEPVICTGGSYMWGVSIGRTFSLKSPYENMVTSETPISELPSNPVEYGIYYTNQYNYLHCACWDYINGQWTWVTDNGQINAHFKITELSDELTYIGINSDLISTEWNSDYISEGLRSASVEQDTKKFYLEINGDEK